MINAGIWKNFRSAIIQKTAVKQEKGDTLVL
jgi:hypothetical protein